MKKSIFLLFMLLLKLSMVAQVAEMKWEIDKEIFLKLTNDSNFTYDIRDAFHVTDTKQEFASEFIFYPVNPGEEYSNVVPGSISDTKYSTLWSALNAKIGGGWVHFTNCIAYALETKKLDLTSPLMKRPESKWKPKPVTESYKHTKNWEYYVPVNQKIAQKEYKLRLEEDDIGDIRSLPRSYINLFLNTSQKEYDDFKHNNRNDLVAKIDLVKVLLGAKYLSEIQITYISNKILESVQSYSSNRLPSVIVFDEYDAAALMSLNVNGYNIDKIVFRGSAYLREDIVEQRQQEIQKIIAKINEYNQNSFKKRLGNSYIHK